MEPQEKKENEETVIEKDIEDTVVINEESVVLKHSEHLETVPGKKPLLSLPAAILTGFALLALAIILVVPGMNKGTGAKPADEAPKIPTSVEADVAKLRTTDHVKGNAETAEVLLITYSDSDCPFCARFHPTVQTTLTDYKGKVAWVYRQFPLDMHPNAYTESLALECAAKLGGDKTFFSYLDTIVNVTLTPDPASNETLLTFAKNEGLDVDQFKACFADKNIVKKIDADIDEANKIGARGTPFSIAVNKRTGEQVVIPGAYPLDEVKQMIDSIL